MALIEVLYGNDRLGEANASRFSEIMELNGFSSPRGTEDFSIDSLFYDIFSEMGE